MTAEELGFLKEEIDSAKEYQDTTLSEVTDDEHYFRFESLLTAATVLWEACSDFLKQGEQSGSD